jgi:hypothetical protein
MHYPSNLVVSPHVITSQFGGATEFIALEKLTRRCGRIAVPGNSILLYIPAFAG